MNSFTVELVSNASMNVYPGNTLSTFTNFLPEQINLEGEWEVAIAEISYPSMYQNISKGQFRYTDGEVFDTIEHLFELDAGFYESLQDVCLAMNEKIGEQLIPSRSDYVKISFDKRTNNVQMRFDGKSPACVLYQDDLQHVLGCAPNKTLVGNGPFTLTHSPDIARYHTLMVYSDILEYSIVGDTKAPLLRCFPLVTKLKNVTVLAPSQFIEHKSFEQLQYRRLLKNSFHSIQIDIRDQTGERIPFMSVGVTRLTLLFRKVNHSHP